VGERIDLSAVSTPFGTLGVAATARGIAAVFTLGRDGRITPARVGREPALARRVRAGARIVIHREPGTHPPALARAVAALRAYASGTSRRVRAPFDLQGTPFQVAVWRRLTSIPFGRTTTYGALAASLGRPRASRAVGAAVGANPVGILIPCHRVVGSNGALTGFGWGLPMKRALLRHEGSGLGRPRGSGRPLL
jgi:O-6-methylguanine DNA methyltransferase